MYAGRVVENRLEESERRNRRDERDDEQHAEDPAVPLVVRHADSPSCRSPANYAVDPITRSPKRFHFEPSSTGIAYDEIRARSGGRRDSLGPARSAGVSRQRMQRLLREL